jgi:DNA-binding transcriptional LysR family regulator
MLRTFELGMISFKPDPAQFRTIAVYADSLAFIVSPRHPLAGAERVSIADLGEELFVAHNVTSPLRQKVIETFQRFRTPLNMAIELADHRGDQAICGHGKRSGARAPLDGGA